MIIIFKLVMIDTFSHVTSSILIFKRMYFLNQIKKKFNSAIDDVRDEVFIKHFPFIWK